MAVEHIIVCDHCHEEITPGTNAVEIQKGVISSGAKYIYRDNTPKNDYHAGCYYNLTHASEAEAVQAFA